MTSTKTKFRNKMQLHMLDALLRIKMHFNVYNMCCVDFKPCEEMIKFDSSIYLNPRDKTDDVDAEEILTLLNEDNGEL